MAITQEDVQAVIQAIRNSPELIRDAHALSDTDYAQQALHHTLGLGANQASPGSHKHSGKDGSLSLTGIILGSATVSGVLYVGTAGGGIELGSTSNAALTPFIDFHAAGLANDYDVRLITSGGSPGTNGIGSFTVVAATTFLTGSFTATNNIEATGVSANILTQVRSNNLAKWAMYSQTGSLSFWWNGNFGGASGDKFSISNVGDVSLVGAIVTALLVSGAFGYGSSAGTFQNSSGAAKIMVGDGPRYATVGCATGVGDWTAGTQPGDMVLMATNQIVINGNWRILNVGTRTTSVVGGTANALPANPVGYMGVMINGTARVIPYYT